jgi:hypothetical protein
MIIFPKPPCYLAPRAHWSWGVGLVLLAVAGGHLILGCQSMRLLSEPPSKNRPGEHPVQAVAELAPLPRKHVLRIAPYVFLSDREITAKQPLFQELALLRDQVCRELQLPESRTPVQVHLFTTKTRYEAFMKQRYPRLPPRRAFFVAQPHGIGGGEDLLVYTYWSEHTRKDLRHELTHALLHAVIRDVPLWLDEGLAEFFELPPVQHGINSDHLQRLRTDLGESYRLDLARLEKLRQVDEMNRPEYREAWAWVSLMLRGEPRAREVLVDYLRLLRNNRDPGLLRPRLAVLWPTPEEALLHHLDTLPGKKVPGTFSVSPSGA